MIAIKEIDWLMASYSEPGFKNDFFIHVKQGFDLDKHYVFLHKIHNRWVWIFSGWGRRQ